MAACHSKENMKGQRCHFQDKIPHFQYSPDRHAAVQNRNVRFIASYKKSMVTILKGHD